MPDIFNSEHDIKQELQLKLIMLESSREDPLLAANMVSMVEDTYKLYNIPIPKNIRKFLDVEKERIAPLIHEIIKEKTYERNLWIDEQQKNVRDQELQRRLEEEVRKAKGMTRTQLIFGE